MSELVVMKGAAVLLAAAASVALAPRVSAGNISGDKATALTGNGVVTVQVGTAGTTPAQADGASRDGVVCTDTPLSPSDALLLAPGAPGPGAWFLPNCIHAGYVNPLPPMWVPASTPQPRVSPRMVAQQAIARAVLPAAAIEMAPAAGRDQLTGARTWLWVDPGMWHSFSVTASAGPVTATATATPSRVVWDLGDDDRVTCDGPGTPYDPSRPDSSQSTACSYVWPRSSADQPGSSFVVTATVYWQVSWAARGAPGGGSLGTVASPPARVEVRVAEADAVNSGSGA